MLVEPDAESASDTSITTIQADASTLSWKRFFNDRVVIHGLVIFYTLPKDDAVVYVLHHGAGSSALSFALLSRHLLALNTCAGFLAIDVRGHGDSKDCDDYSIESLCQDFNSSLEYFVDRFKIRSKLILVGHSMGGSVIARSSHIKNVAGIVVIDVVEGSAMENLHRMIRLLNTRPKSFPSTESAIEWHLRSQILHNRESAEISVPALLSSTENGYTWRTNLIETKKYWPSWFSGLSKIFLSAKVGKLLLLAGTDRLDKDLMIGQMQGAYQLHILPGSGHFVHEDHAEQVAKQVNPNL